MWTCFRTFRTWMRGWIGCGGRCFVYYLAFSVSWEFVCKCNEKRTQIWLQKKTSSFPSTYSEAVNFIFVSSCDDSFRAQIPIILFVWRCNMIIILFFLWNGLPITLLHRGAASYHFLAWGQRGKPQVSGSVCYQGFMGRVVIEYWRNNCCFILVQGRSSLICKISGGM